MSGALLIFLFALVVFVCALAIARRSAEDEERRQAKYLDGPTWRGSMAGGAPTTDLTAPAAATPARPSAPETAHATSSFPRGARVRATQATSMASAARRQEQLVDEVVRGLEQIPPLPRVLF